MPDNIRKEMGHFNVFRLDDFSGPSAKPIPYSRKEYYKVSFIIGRNRVHYADKTIEADKQVLLFANPQIPYNWEPLDEQQSGFFCIFTEAFFNQFGNIKDYPVFKPGGNPIFFIPDEQVEAVRNIYLAMFTDLASDYVYKYDVLKTRVFELIHMALRMQPATTLYTNQNAATRISSLFMELLERQFPIESPVQRIRFRSATDFANQLSVHVNHLNRALKETTGKTTSQVTGERIIQEAKVLIKHTNWNISEIAYCLGFEELPHFINFFKKSTRVTPTCFRTMAV